MTWQGKCSQCGEPVRGGSDDRSFVRVPDERKGQKALCLMCLLVPEDEGESDDLSMLPYYGEFWSPGVVERAA